MSNHLGFRELILDQSILTQWRSITIDTGAAQSTLQDIKVPEYGGCYMYDDQSGFTRNRYIFWRVCHDLVELWEESLDQDIRNCNIQLKFADTPVLEGLSIHETQQHIVILVATVSSVHRIRLRHPMANGRGELSNESVFSELTYHSLRDIHYHHVFSTGTAGESLPHTAGSYLQSNNSGGSALFILGLSNGSLVLVTVANLNNAVYTHTIAAASMMNRFFTGFVPNRFRTSDGSDAISSLALAELSEEPYAFGICIDGRLRAWNLQKMEMVLVHNCLENTAEVGRKMNPGAHRHLLRICSTTTNSNGNSPILLGVYLNFSEKQMIVILQPVKVLGQLAMKIVKTLYPPQYDLVDLCITSHYIWSLWTDQNNDSKLFYSPLLMNGPLNGFSPGFNEAFLEQFPERTIPLSDPAIDPMESYMKELMENNRFSAFTLQKALGIYRHNFDSKRNAIKDSATIGVDSDTSLSGLWKLAEAVELALKEEIESRIAPDMGEEEIADIKLNAWATFYSHTLQYHQVGRKPVSLVDVGGGGIISIIRKQSTTWIRPIDALELLMLSSETTPSVTSLIPVLTEETSIAIAMIAISKALRFIKDSLDPEVKSAFCTDLHHLESPDQVSSSISTSLLAGGDCMEMEEHLSQVIEQHLSSVPGVIGGFEAYLKALGLDKGNPDALSLAESLSSSDAEFNPLKGAFSSSFGSSILSSCVYQLAHQRLELCRDLLILQHIILLLNIVQSNDSNRMLSTLLPQTTILTQAYFALMEVSSFPATIPTPAGMDASKRQMATLSLSKNNMPVMKSNSPLPATSLGMFVQFGGGTQARLLLENYDNRSFNGKNNWSHLLLPLTTTISQLAWPISRCLSLLEFLVWGGQQPTAQAYVRLLQKWCEWNSCSRKFLLGVSLLGEGESRKAKRLFLEASEGLSTEEYLGLRVCARTTFADSLEALTVQYCLKCVRLLEQAGYIEHALDLATNALSLASSSDSQGLAALYSVAFKHHLDLWHHDKAFTAFLACPDESRRRNCLRQMIITLYDRKCLSTLIGYTYGTLEPEVVKILENRARSADILVNNYYDLLFAFHVSKFNYKKAAWVMYECALRLNVEGLGGDALHQQAKCYLSCLNCLRHIPKDQAWIIKPLSKSNGSLENSPQKEMEDDDVSCRGLRALKASKKRPQIQLMEIGDIEREYELVHARIKIYKEQSSNSSRLPVGPMSSSDTISLLGHLHLFKDAARLSLLFGLSLEPVIQILASACVQTDRSGMTVDHDWTTRRDTNKKCNSAHYWKLLKEFLETEEIGQQSHLHRAATAILLSEGHSVPAWLHDSYKKRNCGELINFYLREGMLDDATRLTMELLDGLLGRGTEQLGLKNALHASQPAVWFPYTTVDHLMLELKEIRDSDEISKLYNGLESKMNIYKNEVLRVSQDRLLLLR